MKKNKRSILGEVYKKYNRETNMTVGELRKWAADPLSKKASLNRKPVMMAIRLKGKPLSKWGQTEFRWAVQKAIPYLKRAKKIRSNKVVKKGYTRNQIALKNWGMDVKKKRRK